MTAMTSLLSLARICAHQRNLSSDSGDMGVAIIRAHSAASALVSGTAEEAPEEEELTLASAPAP
jgi:hypothetical protein